MMRLRYGVVADVLPVHMLAMELADEADVARRDGNLARATDLFRRAFVAEKYAAELWMRADGREPTRSILFRSAAWLAVNCEENERAAQMAEMGLAGAPEPKMEAELHEILAAANNRVLKL